MCYGMKKIHPLNTKLYRSLSLILRSESKTGEIQELGSLGSLELKSGQYILRFVALLIINYAYESKNSEINENFNFYSIYQ